MNLSAAERTSLEGELAALVARYGNARMCEAKLVEPTAEFFPDAFVREDADSALTLACRIFDHAGLGEIEITVDSEAFSLRRAAVEPIRGGDDRVEQLHERTGPASLVDLGESACTIGVDARDPTTLAAALCRVAARVFLERHAESYRDAPSHAVAASDEVLRAGEIASVFLGFGIITSNDAYRFTRTRPRVVTHRTCGVLSYEAMTCVLAAWWRARGGDRRERRRIHASLDANQQSSFDVFAAPP
jgi:hypothetical protein